MGEIAITTARGAQASGETHASQLSHGELLQLARAHPELAWSPQADMRDARNAHFTNTRGEMAAALRGPHDWLEGDVRLGPGGRAVMQHDVGDAVDLDLGAWLEVARASGRGAKVDVKVRSAIPAAMEALTHAGIPDHRLIINLGSWSIADVLQVRRTFPHAIIAIGPEGDRELDDRGLVRLQLAASMARGPVMFPVRHDMVTPRVVDALLPFGRVAVWNSPGLTDPGPRDPGRLRDMGVDGMIDLREPEQRGQRTSATVIEGAAWLIGWAPVRAALDATGYL